MRFKIELELNDDSKEILIGECKYLNTKVDTDIFYKLVEKANCINWNKGNRTEHYVLFSKLGFTDHLLEVSKKRDDLLLVSL
ncbi:MAG: hypothetical protein N4A64_01520 [Marinisporobacter sp.]|jgi:hypothetical protein|nr:hypothetical protein [Marinisporobacter sp.]